MGRYEGRKRFLTPTQTSTVLRWCTLKSEISKVSFKNFGKKFHNAEKGWGKSPSAEKLERGPFWVLYFKLEAFEWVQNQVLSTFGTYRVSYLV